MTTVIRAAGAADFLALVPRLLGHRPERGLVLVPFSGTRTLGAMRVDLPDAAETAELERVASTVIGLVCKVAHADAVAAVVFTDRPIGPEGALPHDELLRALLRRADLCGLRASEALCLAADGWGSYLDATHPPGGRPLAEIPFDHEAFADLPMAPGDPAHGAELPAVPADARARVAGLLAQGGERLPEAAPSLYERALEGPAEALSPEDAATLIRCLARPALRDVALLQWARDRPTGDLALAAQLAWAEGAAYPPDLAATIWGDGPCPEPARLEIALALARRLAALAPDPEQPGVLSACAWLAWALGRSTHAGRYATAALAIDPEHGMAQIVLALVENAHLPEWAYDREDTHDIPVSRLVDSGGVES